MIILPKWSHRNTITLSTFRFTNVKMFVEWLWYFRGLQTEKKLYYINCVGRNERAKHQKLKYICYNDNKDMIKFPFTKNIKIQRIRRVCLPKPCQASFNYLQATESSAIFSKKLNGRWFTVINANYSKLSNDSNRVRRRYLKYFRFLRAPCRHNYKSTFLYYVLSADSL